MKTILFLCALLLTSVLSFAQTIKGKLIDSKTNKEIPLVNLMISHKKDTALIRYTNSDTSGLFEFRKIPLGNYILSARSIGYQLLQQEINLSSTTLDLGNLSMAEDPTLLKEVIINGGQPNFAMQNGQIKIGIANNTFFKSASNLLDVFRRLPGLQVNQDGTILMGNRATPTLFVDGKPLNMNGEEIQIYLNSLTPAMVESIELINQPSSRFDGEYQGIIDVKLKRNQTLGLRGVYNTRFQRNNQSLLDNGFSLTYKTNQFVYNLDLGHSIGNTFYNYHSLQYLASTNAMTTDTKTITANNNFNAQARITYEPKGGQSFEAFIRTYQINREAKTANELLSRTANLNHTISLVNSDNKAIPKQDNYAGGINYSGRFKNSELNIVSSFAQIDNQQTEDIQNRNALKNELISYWKTNSRNKISIRALQADYIHNLDFGKIDFGGKFAYTTTQNNLRYDTLSNTGFNLDAKRSNQFKYQEYILAGYLSYSRKWGKFNYSLSLRTEHTHTIATSITETSITERDYLKWLPSINLAYAFSGDQQLSFVYSRRITRPSFPALNPFRFYYSPRHYWIGNPYLQPSTTNLFALSYSKKSFLVSINAGREVDPMSRYPEYNPVTDELIFLGRNLPYRNFANVQVSSPISVNKWWRMNNNIGLYYNKELTPYFGQTYSIPIYNYIINGSQVFSLKNWLLDVSYVYESKGGNGLYVSAPVFGMDVGLQKAWLKNKINTKLTLYNVFNTVKRRFIFREKGLIDNDFTHYFGPQRLVFTFSYNFGSSTYKAKDSKRSEEENRAN